MAVVFNTSKFQIRQKYAAYLAPWAKEEVVSWSFLEDEPRVLRIYVDPAMERKDDLESAIQSYSVFFCTFNAGSRVQADAEVRVDEKGRFGLFWKISPLPLFLPVERPLKFIRNCEMIGRWIFLKTMDNGGLRELNRSDVILNVKRYEGVTLSNISSLEGEIVSADQVKLTDSENGSAGISLSIEIKTHGYYVGVLYLGDGYGITKCSIDAGFAKDGQIYTMFFEQQGTVYPLLPVKLDQVRIKQGVTQMQEYVKVFISKQPLDLDAFEQESTLLESTTRLSRGTRMSEAPDFSDVMVLTVPVTLSTQPTITPLAEAGGDLFTIKDVPSGFQAPTGLVSHRVLEEQGILGKRPYEYWGAHLPLRQVFDTPTSIPEKEAAILLEMHYVRSPFTPFKLIPKIPLIPEEAIIPYGRDALLDGNGYLPLGYTDDHGEVHIIKLPSATAVRLSNNLEQMQSLKILFHRITYPNILPSLLLIRKDLTSTSDPQQIQMALARSRNALLLVHGLAGNMEAMAYGVIKNSPLADSYDAILAYQYDPLLSDVTEVAQDLKQRMAQVGMTGEGVGRATCIVAHGTGGLLCRWLIEKEGMAPYIDHLVMVGTPQEGINRSEMAAYAVALMGQALNGPEVYKNYLQYLPFLAKDSDWPSLRNLEQGSDFIRQLNDGDVNARGGVEYRVVAGGLVWEQKAPVKEEEKVTPEEISDFEKETRQREIIDIIAKGNADLALKMLLDLSLKYHLEIRDEVVQLSGRLSSLQQQELQGVISFSDASIERNKINSSLLQLARRM